MSYNPITGYAYLSAQNIPMNLTAQKEWKHNASVPGNPMSGLGWNLGFDMNTTPPKSEPLGRLIAWDPGRCLAFDELLEMVSSFSCRPRLRNPRYPQGQERYHNRMYPEDRLLS
jgi:hypothetical protein